MLLSSFFGKMRNTVQKHILTYTLLCMFILLFTGCKKIESDLNKGRIRITGSRMNVAPVVVRLIHDHQWKKVSSKYKSSVNREVFLGFKISTETGIKLPHIKTKKTSSTCITAQTKSDQQVKFTIDKSKGKKITINITAGPGESVSVASITAELAGRLDSSHYIRTRHDNKDRESISFKIDRFVRSEDSNSLTAKWSADSDILDSYRHLKFAIKSDKKHSFNFSIYLQEPVVWQAAGDSNNTSAQFELTRSAGVMVFKGVSSFGTSHGQVIFTPDMSYVNALDAVVSDKLSQDDILSLFFWEIDLSYAKKMAGVFVKPPSLSMLRKLQSYHVTYEFAAGIFKAGYKFSAAEIIKLKNYRIPLKMLREFKKAGYSYSVSQLIKIKNYRLSIDQFVGFKNAGYDFTIKENIKAKNYRVSVDTARKFHSAGLSYSLEELIKLKSYRIEPEFVIAFRKAGYKWPVPGLIRAKNYRISAQKSVRLKKAGYNFSLDDLIRLNNYHVSQEFMLAVIDPRYKPFTVQELVDFKNKRISADAIKKIRQTIK